MKTKTLLAAKRRKKAQKRTEQIRRGAGELSAAVSAALK
jgi:hypothetical protein